MCECVKSRVRQVRLWGHWEGWQNMGVNKKREAVRKREIK